MAATSIAARARARAGVEAILKRYNAIVQKTGYNGFDKHLMDNVRLVDAGPEGSVQWALDITEAYGNVNGVMHGGAAGVIFDMCTTTALGPLSKEGYWEFLGGVTRSLNISYLKGVPIGSTVHIHGKVLQVGKTMALIQGKMTSVDGHTVYCTCEHHKVHVPTKKEHLAIKINMDAFTDARGDNAEGGSTEPDRTDKAKL